ncbi:MAG TPA: efflux transporter outer membrane subunit [Burkholderiales bacterium]|nr:efflux transporter outer membrane subunit [Burkholderiales bacterium]
MLERKTLALALIAGVLAGCSVWPGYKKPAMELPQQWSDAPAQGQPIVGERWWTLYGDPTLDALVDEALKNNLDLAAAAARVDEARALLVVTDSQRLPSVDATIDANRARSSARSSIPLPPSVPLERSTYTAQVNVAYELDLWGRLRGQTDAARAQLLASAAARDTVRIALSSQVVQTYYTLLSLDDQVEVTQRTLDLRAQNYALEQYRYKSGLITDFHLRQLEAEIAAARAQLPALQQRRASAQTALAILLGRSPRAIANDAVLVTRDAGEQPIVVIPEGLPSDLLLRRPDVVQAEQTLIAANAQIGVARAALFPRIALTGAFGSDSATLGDLFSGPARIWSLAFGLAQPIFQGGRLRAEVEAANARERQALAQYQKTVQTAFGEVRDALQAQARTREVYAAETERVAALRETLRLSRIRFDNGLSSQLETIDAERNLLQAELNRVDALRAQRAAVADVVRALGGGWQGLDPQVALRRSDKLSGP